MPENSRNWQRTMAGFDKIIITAANDAQAAGYRAQTRGDRRIVVIADPGGRRVGSLGATVNALRECKVKKGRTLICHSGGDARRTPGYAAMGKAFIPLKDGRSLFEHIVEHMEKLPLKDGVLVVSGDVLLTFDYAKTDFSRPGVTGVAYPGDAWQARRHGVYVEQGGKVTGFLQKPQVTEGTHLIDTGIMFIDLKTAEKMKSLPVAGDIYEEFPKMLLEEGFADFHVNVCKECEFFHVGSSRELLELLGDGNTYVDKAWCKLELAGGNVVTNVPPGRFEKLTLKKNECFTVLPLENGGWYDLKYMLDDNFKSDGLWEKHGLAEKMKQVDHERLLAIRKMGSAKRCKVTAPVRIDFAGGWSDTPPICELEGGTVVNAAVLLNKVRPVEVTVKERKDKDIKVISKDLGKRRMIRSAEEIEDHSNPHDWCALVKSALTVTGFRFGTRGLDITISADLPKGSGMGTSSVLGAATIAALLNIDDDETVSKLTLQLEQEMCTGGGWQDQVGGLVGGFKLIKSMPGKEQKLEIRKLEAPKEFLKALKTRGLLYFTGQKRMARNILRKVLGFYAENPHNFGKILVESLKADAEKCAAAIEQGDLEKFAEAVNGYWRDKKLLDSGSTNERVEMMIDKIRDYASAVTLTGAGGGGFMFILGKTPADARKIVNILTKDPPSKYSRFYHFALDGNGLSMEKR